MKRMLSLLLCLSMLAGPMTLTAVAASEEAAPDAPEVILEPEAGGKASPAPVETAEPAAGEPAGEPIIEAGAVVTDAASAEAVNAADDEHTNIEDEILANVPENPVTGGTLSDSLSWAVKDGVLTISGQGAMPAYTGDSRPPWYDCRGIVTEIAVSEGIPGLTGFLFQDMVLVSRVTLPEGLLAIEAGVFKNCVNLTSLLLPSTIRDIGENAFENCYGLQAVSVAPRTGYSFEGWADGSGSRFSCEDIAAGKEYAGHLNALWERAWTDGMFTDVAAGAWYHAPVKYCYQYDLMVGTSDTAFSPNSYATRAQVVAVLYRLAGKPAVTGSSGFQDVPGGTWYTDAVTWAMQTKVTAGTTKDTFAPNAKVTREQFITFLYRYAGLTGIIANDWSGEGYSLGLDFADTGKISSWALAAENWSVNVGLQVGSPAGKESTEYVLNPGGKLRRSEMAQFLYAFTTGRNHMSVIDRVEALRGQPAGKLTELFGKPDAKDETTIEGTRYYLWVYKSKGFTILTEWNDSKNEEYVSGVQFASAALV